ncbi:MAG: hypothetical protein EOP22_14545 [Hyphomicrobiales bacterium]|nr:MAG: hypothetical protein EOP22_14545 [Hyphomicrobiales bacterium]
MVAKWKILAALVLMALAALPVQAETIGPFRLSDDDPRTLYLDRTIEDAAALDFLRALRKRPEVTTLVLNSDGGLVEQALLIAHEISERGLDTYVPAGSGCYSACAYVFLAGANRKAVGELGVHQVYGPDDDFDVVGTQIALSDVLDALNEFGVRHEVVSEMLRTPPDSMYVFSTRELADLGIDRTPSRDFAELDALLAKPPIALSGVATAGCRPIESRTIALEACVAHDFVEVAGTGAQEFVFGLEDDSFGLMLVTEQESFSQQAFRDAIIDNAIKGADGAEADVQVLSERHASILGREFDVIVYNVKVDGMLLMFQNNYYSDPALGALQIIGYSKTADSFAAAIRLQAFLATLQLGEPAEESRLLDPPREMDIGL